MFFFNETRNSLLIFFYSLCIIDVPVRYVRQRVLVIWAITVTNVPALKQVNYIFTMDIMMGPVTNTSVSHQKECTLITMMLLYWQHNPNWSNHQIIFPNLYPIKRHHWLHHRHLLLRQVVVVVVIVIQSKSSKMETDGT